MVNHLGDESSPYLRQHADNPVDWWPWCEDAFAEARRRDVPVLLSVGYSACHWCHVMAHESFENDETAATMSARFVNVKVDREERPDVDAVYMDAVTALTGRGGWPMTVFLTPDAAPFFGGTYFPPEPRPGMPSFGDVLNAVSDAWNGRRDELDDQAAALTAALGGGAALRPADALPDLAIVAEAAEALLASHDRTWGGFGGAPKFPTPHNLDLLLRHHVRSGDEDTLRAAMTTLDAMASGGMYDHLGGGFARYSTDRAWLVPHFEKMLYDQAGLVRLYTRAYATTGAERYAQIVDETIGYVDRDLRLPGGGIASAEDADSLDDANRSVEGAFYTFTLDEVRAVLDGAGLDSAAAIEWWELDTPPNFEGRWIPARTRHRGYWERPPSIEACRMALFAHRAKRPRPGLDDKVVTEWNAHWIAAVAEAGARFDRADWLDRAERTAHFLGEHLRRGDGRWLRSWQSSTGGRTPAFAADLAALVDAFTRLAEATGRAAWLAEAVAVAETLLGLFWDDEHGGLFTVGRDAEQLIVADKDLQDSALPSANSTAAVALARLGSLTGNDRYSARAAEIVRLAAPLAHEAPLAFGALLHAVELLHDPTEVVVTGDRPDLVRTAIDHLGPNDVLAWGERTDSPLWHGRTDGRAYVCVRYACRLPATTPAELAGQLADRH